MSAPAVYSLADLAALDPVYQPLVTPLLRPQLAAAAHAVSQPIVDAAHPVAIPPQREPMVIGYTLTHAQVSYLSKAFPMFSPQAGRRISGHTHPIAAYERRACEELAVRHLRRKFPGIIADIGGNSDRHLQHGRHDVHSLAPSLDPYDALRHATRTPGNHFCTCRVEACQHLGFADTLLCVHSSYYMTPDVLLDALLTVRRHYGLVVCHDYNSPFGTHCQGEAKYSIDDDCHIRNTIGGRTYRHPVQPWLARSYHDNARGAMAWAEFARYGDTVIYEFSVVPRTPGWSAPPPVSLTSAVRSPDAFGAVRLSGPGNDRADTIAHFVRVNTASDASVFAWPVSPTFAGGLSITTSTMSILLPRPLVHQLAARIAMADRSKPHLFGHMKAIAGDMIKRYNMPDEFVAPSISYAAAIAYTMYAGHDLAMLRTYVQPGLATASLLSRALNFEFPWHLTATHTDIAMLASSVLFLAVWWHRRPDEVPWPAAARDDDRRILVQYLRMGSLLPRLLRAFLRSRWAPPAFGVALMFTLLYRHRARLPFWQSLAEYSRRIHVPAPFVAVEPLTTLQSLNTALPLQPTRKGAVIVPPVLYDPAPLDDGKHTLSHPGISVASAVPTTHAQTVVNQMGAVANRLCADAPYDLAFLREFSAFADESAHVLYPGWGRRKVYPNFELWVRRFPGGLQRNLRAARAALDAGEVLEKRFYRRKGFGKVEKSKPAVDTGGEDSDMRFIAAPDDSFNARVGPVVWELFLMWKDALRGGPISCASSSTGEQIGDRYQRRINAGRANCAVLLADASRFDKSVNVVLLIAFIHFLRKAGTDDIAGFGADNLSTVLTKSLDIHLRTTGGIFVRMPPDSTVVASGDPWTAFADSWVNATMWAFTICRRHDITATQFVSLYANYGPQDDAAPVPLSLDPRPWAVGPIWQRHTRIDVPLYSSNPTSIEGYRPPWTAIEVQGDDSVITFEWDCVDIDAYVADWRRAGFVLKIRIHYQHDNHKVDFCSSLFWPVDDGRIVLAPKTGRILARLGFLANPPQGLDQRSIMRGVALGLIKSVNHIPYANHITRRLLALTEGHTPIVLKQFGRFIEMERVHTCTDDTWGFFLSRYGVTDDELNAFCDAMEHITLGDLLHFPFLDSVIKRDRLDEDADPKRPSVPVSPTHTPRHDGDDEPAVFQDVKGDDGEHEQWRSVRPPDVKRVPLPPPASRIPAAGPLPAPAQPSMHDAPPMPPIALAIVPRPPPPNNAFNYRTAIAALAPPPLVPAASFFSHVRSAFTDADIEMNRLAYRAEPSYPRILYTNSRPTLAAFLEHVVFAPLIEEPLKHACPWWFTPLFVAAEAAQYAYSRLLVEGAPTANRAVAPAVLRYLVAYLPTAVLHGVCKALPVRYAIFLHAIWNFQVHMNARVLALRSARPVPASITHRAQRLRALLLRLGTRMRPVILDDPFYRTTFALSGLVSLSDDVDIPAGVDARPLTDVCTEILRAKEWAMYRGMPETAWPRTNHSYEFPPMASLLAPIIRTAVTAAAAAAGARSAMPKGARARRRASSKGKRKRPHAKPPRRASDKPRFKQRRGRNGQAATQMNPRPGGKQRAAFTVRTSGQRANAVDHVSFSDYLSMPSFTMAGQTQATGDVAIIPAFIGSGQATCVGVFDFNPLQMSTTSQLRTWCYTRRRFRATSLTARLVPYAFPGVNSPITQGQFAFVFDDTVGTRFASLGQSMPISALKAHNAVFTRTLAAETVVRAPRHEMGDLKSWSVQATGDADLSVQTTLYVFLTSGALNASSNYLMAKLFMEGNVIFSEPTLTPIPGSTDMINGAQTMSTGNFLSASVTTAFSSSRIATLPSLGLIGGFAPGSTLGCGLAWNNTNSEYGISFPQPGNYIISWFVAISSGTANATGSHIGVTSRSSINNWSNFTTNNIISGATYGTSYYTETFYVNVTAPNQILTLQVASLLGLTMFAATFVTITYMQSGLMGTYSTLQGPVPPLEFFARVSPPSECKLCHDEKLCRDCTAEYHRKGHHPEFFDGMRRSQCRYCNVPAPMHNDTESDDERPVVVSRHPARKDDAKR
jgi:hypothetical protein